MTCLVTELLSPSQIGPAMTRMSAAMHLLVERRPVVGGPAVLGHVRPHAGGDVVVDGPDHVDRARPGVRMMRSADVDQPAGVAELRDRLRVQLMNRARRSS